MWPELERYQGMMAQRRRKVKELKGVRVERIIVMESRPVRREVRACDTSGTDFSWYVAYLHFLNVFIYSFSKHLLNASICATHHFKH